MLMQENRKSSGLRAGEGEEPGMRNEDGGVLSEIRILRARESRIPPPEITNLQSQIRALDGAQGGTEDGTESWAESRSGNGTRAGTEAGTQAGTRVRTRAGTQAGTQVRT